MIEVEILFAIERPMHLVFGKIRNIVAHPQWVPEKSEFVLENKITSEGPFGLGTTYTDNLTGRGGPW
jgi:hypothetical protein